MCVCMSVIGHALVSCARLLLRTAENHTAGSHDDKPVEGTRIQCVDISKSKSTFRDGEIGARVHAGIVLHQLCTSPPLLPCAGGDGVQQPEFITPTLIQLACFFCVACTRAPLPAHLELTLGTDGGGLYITA